MDTLFDLAKFILPSIIVFLTAYYAIKKFLDNEHKVRILEMRKENQNTTLPLRLQAYERSVLFLERISPDALVKRIYKQGMDARGMQSLILTTIRTEYEHNISQQIYISEQAWSRLKTTKEEIIKLVNIASGRVRDDATGLDLSKAILELASKLDRNPTHLAIEFIKKEIRQLF